MNRTVVKTVNAGIKAGVAYCAVIETSIRGDEERGDILGTPFGTTSTSNEMCSEGSKLRQCPGRRLHRRHHRRGQPAHGHEPQLLGQLLERRCRSQGRRHPGPDLGLARRTAPPESGTFNGFQCAATGTTGYRCTGGTLAKGAKNQIPVLATVARNGPGAIHATITATGDTNTVNNANTHNVMAVPPGS